MRADKKKTGENKAKAKKQRNAGNVLDFLCHAGVYIFLFFFVVIYSFYAPEGYIQIATNKYQFFRSMCLLTGGVMVPLITLRYLLSSGDEQGRKMKQRISLTDVFVFLFLMVNLISFFFTEYKEEALWGTSGWYMGFAMQLFFVGIYIMVSRFYDWKIDVLPVFMGVTFVLFLWGLLNRFSVYPIDMKYDSEFFISSMGNINWFCGFWSVFFVVGVVLYVVTKKRSLRIFSGIYSALALGLGVVEGSDSAFISMGVVFYLLFLVTFQKTVYMKRLLEMGMIYCGACQVMRVITVVVPESLNREEPVAKLMLGNLTLAVFAVLVVLRILLERADIKYKKYTMKSVAVEKDSNMELIHKWKRLKFVVIIVTIVVAVVYLILLIINTRTPGILGPLSKYRVLLFDGAWGSNRGATWRDGMLVYRACSWRQRLFGVGQDCFSIFGYSIPEIAARFKEEWPSSRLTNAHNECITYLVNLGIFGLLSFIGIFGSSFKRLIEKAVKEPVCYVFAASVLSYFCHNQFSFSQVLNTPYIFMMLGLGESLMRRVDAGY